MSSAVETDDILEHYGVKGMKWGVRRERGANGLVGGRTRSGYVNRQNRKADRQIARAKKKASKAQKLVNEREKGIKAAEDAIGRIEAGKATTQENMAYLMTVNAGDVFSAVGNRAGGSSGNLRTAYADNRRAHIGKMRAANKQYVSKVQSKSNAKIASARAKKAHADRVNRGETTAKDLLKYYGTVNLRDTIRG